MKLKKNIISIITIITVLMINLNQVVYASDNSRVWVQKAFDEANSFLTDDSVEDDLGIFGNLLGEFTNIIQGINVVLLVLLAGLSAISLAVVGVKYIMAGDSPHNKENAKKSLHTVFIGMVYGFGAYVIWTISMEIVNLIMGAFAQG